MNHTGHELVSTTYALETKLTLRVPHSASDLRSRLDRFLSDLTCSLESDGCTLVGHIKGLLEVEADGHLFFSLTSFSEKARYKGELTDEIATADLTINIIVYGVQQQSVERAVREGLTRHFAECLQ